MRWAARPGPTHLRRRSDLRVAHVPDPDRELALIRIRDVLYRLELPLVPVANAIQGRRHLLPRCGVDPVLPRLEELALLLEERGLRQPRLQLRTLRFDHLLGARGRLVPLG